MFNIAIAFLIVLGVIGFTFLGIIGYKQYAKISERLKVRKEKLKKMASSVASEIKEPFTFNIETEVNKLIKLKKKLETDFQTEIKSQFEDVQPKKEPIKFTYQSSEKKGGGKEVKLTLKGLTKEDGYGKEFKIDEFTFDGDSQELERALNALGIESAE